LRERSDSRRLAQLFAVDAVAPLFTARKRGCWAHCTLPGFLWCLRKNGVSPRTISNFAVVLGYAWLWQHLVHNDITA